MPNDSPTPSDIPSSTLSPEEPCSPTPVSSISSESTLYTIFPVARVQTEKSPTISRTIVMTDMSTPLRSPTSSPPRVPLPPLPAEATTTTTSRNSPSTAPASTPVAVQRRSNPLRRGLIGTSRKHEEPFHAIIERTQSPGDKERVCSDASSITSHSSSIWFLPAAEPKVSIMAAKAPTLQSMRAVAAPPHIPTTTTTSSSRLRKTRSAEVGGCGGCLPDPRAIYLEGGSDVGGGGGGGGGGTRRVVSYPPQQQQPLQVFQERNCFSSLEPGKRRRSCCHHHNSGLICEMKNKMKHALRGFHISVSISFKEKDLVGSTATAERVPPAPPLPPPPLPQQMRKEMTLRIKNSKVGTCCYEITRSSNSTKDELLTPIDDLDSLFPYSKSLQNRLADWNRHYQNPPPHWVMNFIPRAYLTRGYSLGEDVCGYFQQYPDGCRYRVEYEAIGQGWCLVGTVIPQRPKKKVRMAEDRSWWDDRQNSLGP